MGILTALAEQSQQLPAAVWMQLGDDGEILAYYHRQPMSHIGTIEISGEQWQQQINLGATHVINGEPRCLIRTADASLDNMMQRRWRDNELLITDRYTLADFPITSERRAQVLNYRQALRDMPQTGVKPVRPQWM